jgi:hypothetical protein
METVVNNRPNPSPIKRFVTSLVNVPMSFYILALPLSLAWCLVLGVIDNESDASRPFLERYLDPLMWLWYGLPVYGSILWLASIAQRRGHSCWQTVVWTVPLGCILGTIIGLVAFAIVFGFMKLTKLA